jgi:predicted transporter
MPHPFAATVVATWSMMALDRRWRPEPSWIDRTGRLIGIYWITAGVGIPALNIWQNWR